MKIKDIAASRLEDFNSRFQEINQREAQKYRQRLLTGYANDVLVKQEGPKFEDPARQTWEDQIIILLNARVHEKLGMSIDAYRRSLPAFKDAPSSIRDSFPIPLLVDPRLSNKSQIIGFDDDIESQGLSANDIINRPGIVTPDTPYQIWAADGSNYTGLELGQVLQKFSDSNGLPERGLTFPELLALYRARVEIFFERRPTYDNAGFDFCAAGSEIPSTSDCVPTIYHNYFDLQEFGEFQADNFYKPKPRGGWPSCWNEVVSEHSHCVRHCN
jgi:hypothetical protein